MENQVCGVRHVGQDVAVEQPNSAQTSAAGPGAAVPPAHRVQNPGWRDPRLWAGVALVTVSVVAGSRMLAAADDTVLVWSADRDLVAGTPVAAEELSQVRVKFPRQEDLAAYLPVGAGPPEGRLERPVRAGELLPAAALEPLEGAGLVTLSVPVTANRVPGSVRVGTTVDVWIVPADSDTEGRARRVLGDVQVVEAPGADTETPLAGTERAVVLGFPAPEAPAGTAAPADPVADVVLAAAQGRVVLVGRG